MTFDEWYDSNVWYVNGGKETRSDQYRRVWNAATQAERERVLRVLDRHIASVQAKEHVKSGDDA